MPPLSLTQLKYAAATLPIVVKSTPGISMSMPPSLIGVPVAFLPVPAPQTAFFADAVPDPTGPALFASETATVSATTATIVDAALTLNLIDLIRSPLVASFENDRTRKRWRGGGPQRLRSGSRQVRPPCVGDLLEGPAGARSDQHRLAGRRCGATLRP